MSGLCKTFARSEELSLGTVLRSRLAPSCVAVNFKRFACYDVDLFLMERMARRVAQLDVVIAGPKRKLFQVSSGSGIAPIDVDERVLRDVNKFT